MYILWGTISTIFTIIFEFILLQIPYSIHNKNLSFIVPAGGFIDGMFCAIGIFLYLRIKGLRLKPKHLIWGLLLGFIGFWLIYFMNYKTAFVYEGVINHSFKGVKITNYMFSSTEHFTFLNYLKFIINGISFKATYYAGTLSEEYHFGYNFKSAVFISECVGFCLGGLSIGAIALDNNDNCKKCKSILTVRRLYTFKPEYLEKEMKEIISSLISETQFKDFIFKDREQLKENESFIEVFLKYCNNCKVVYLEYKYMKRIDKKNNNINNDIGWVEDKDKYKRIKIDSDKYCDLTKIKI